VLLDRTGPDQRRPDARPGALLLLLGLAELLDHAVLFHQVLAVVGGEEGANAGQAVAELDRLHTLLELAFGWLLGHPAVATVIAGAAKPGQLTANAAAAGWSMTPDEVAAVTGVVQHAG
jgi:aryl-alcohol dehydrogenase-like predicted oxidoreductase